MKNPQKQKMELRERRARRIRARLIVSEKRPRLSVFRSLKHVSGQIIAPDGRVLVSASDAHLEKAQQKLRGVARAAAVGMLLATRAREKKIGLVAFDKGHYQYHGRVKSFAEAVRKGGVQF